jgi:hypothetical protein
MNTLFAILIVSLMLLAVGVDLGVVIAWVRSRRR